MDTRRRFALLAVAALFGAGGCGGSDPPPSTAVTITIAPAGAQTVTAGGAAVPFTATLTGSTATIAWTLVGPGTLSATSGATTSYTPPAASAVTSATSATLTASVTGATASVAITINPAAPGITIAPPSATVTAGGATQAFTATLVNATGTVTWTLTGPGTLSTTTGLSTTYTPPGAGAVPTATSATLQASNGTVSASATITINPAAAAITIAPPSATVTAGGATQAFTATLVNTTGNVTWTLTGPGTLSTTTGLSTTYTPPAAGAVTSPTTATLQASNGTVNASATITVNPPATITVAGTVVGANGLPADNCTVVIVGRPSVMTDAQGRFSVGGVTPPYDLAVAPNGGEQVAVIYKGLTRTDPTVYFWGYTPGTVRHSLAVTGTLNNSHVVDTTLPFPRAAPARVAFGSPQTTENATATNASPASYGFASLDWYGPSAITGTIDALQWDWDSNQLPTGNWLYGTRADVPIAAGASLGGQAVNMSPLATTSTTGSVTPVANMTVTRKTVWIDFPSSAYITIVSHANPATAFSYNTPSLSSAVATMSVQAEGRLVTNETASTYKERLATNASNVALDLKDPPVLSNPVDGGTNITYTDEFRWSRFAPGVHILLIAGPTGSPSYFIFTMEDRAHLPQLSTLGISGMDLPPATAGYGWAVLGVGPFGSIDEAAGPGLWSPAGDVRYQGMSVARSFTTK